MTDNDGNLSLPETLQIEIILDPPRIKPNRDTAIKVHQAARFEVVASTRFKKKLDYYWDLDGNGLYSDESGRNIASRKFPKKGQYRVGVKVIDDDGLSDSAVFHVEVVNSPPSISCKGDTVLGINDEVLYRPHGFDPDSMPIVLTLDFNGDGKADSVIHSGSAAVRWRFPVPGIYKSRVGCVDDQADSAICVRKIHVIKDEPIVEAGDNMSAVAGDTVRFSGRATTQYSRIAGYSWDFNGDGVADIMDFESRDGNAHYIYQDTGTYKAILTVTNDDNISGYDVVSVKIVPAGILVTGGDTVLVQGERVVLNAGIKSTLGSIKSYQWDLNNDGKYDKMSSSPSITLKPKTSSIIGVVGISASGAVAEGQTFLLVCPSDMVGNFKQRVCVDRYEFPNEKGKWPLSNVTWSEARRACRQKEKRLCSAAEWRKTCFGSDKRPYPYGDAYDRKRCNTEGENVEKAGIHSKCHTKSFIFDMSGNLWEWVESPHGESLIVGGDWKSESKSGCGEQRIAKANTKLDEIGFRCCK